MSDYAAASKHCARRSERDDGFHRICVANRRVLLPYDTADSSQQSLKCLMLRLALSVPAIVSALCMACAPLPKATAPNLDTAVAVTAIWRMQNVNFDYHGTSARYSCSGLRAKIRSILRAVGAHESLLVEIRCNAGEFPRVARAHIVVATPIEATEENVRAATTYDSTDQLVARLRGVRPLTANDIQRFPAVWRRI